MARKINDISKLRQSLFVNYDIQTIGLILFELIIGRKVFLYRKPELASQAEQSRTLLAEMSELPKNLLVFLDGCLSVRSEFLCSDNSINPAQYLEQECWSKSLI